MIISVSRRTDIPAFYSKWFINRIKEGFVDYLNPFDSTKASRINLNPKFVTCFVFWTKNPKPLMQYINDLKNYRYYFQYTLNSYEKEIEPNVPSLDDSINIFISLSKKIGKEKVIWRYDPIFLTTKYDVNWHINKFKYIASKLASYTEKVVISFIDLYKKTERNTKELNITELSFKEMDYLAKNLSEIAHKYNLKIATCAEKIDLNKYGIEHNRCIDNELIERLFNIAVTDKKDGQRPNCDCVKCADIGMYNTCMHHCKYCYATFNKELAIKNNKIHDPNSSLLLGELDKNVKIYEAKQEEVKEKKYEQLTFSI